MPTLLRYNELPAYAQDWIMVRRERLRHALLWKELPADERDWRLCFYLVNSGNRSAENRLPVFLTENTPRELLGTIRISESTVDRETGLALLAAAIHALDFDAADCKRPILILADWLEEHSFPEVGMLRAFGQIKQRWHQFMLMQSPETKKPGARLSYTGLEHVRDE
jgi:hypothetical protein